jgi:predicted PurR-regulated permease PerM
MTRLITDGRVGNLERALVDAGQSLAGSLGDLALVLILSIYWSADRLHFERLVLSLLPARRRSAARNTWRTIEAGLGRYLRSELLQSALAGLLLAPIFMALDLRWPVFWALAASLAWLVPMVGGFLVIVPMAVVVWVQSGPVTALLAVAATLAVLGLLEFGLERRLYPRERGANVLTIMIALVMADAFGLVGLLLAPPVAAVLHVLLSELANPSAVRAPRPALEADLAGLEAQLAEARALMASHGSDSAPRLVSMADRLEVLLAETRRLSG